MKSKKQAANSRCAFDIQVYSTLYGVFSHRFNSATTHSFNPNRHLQNYKQAHGYGGKRATYSPYPPHSRVGEGVLFPGPEGLLIEVRCT
jgi:hypothetical protein